MPHPISSERIWKELEPREHHSNEITPLSKGGQPFCLGTALGLLKGIESVQKDIVFGFNLPFSINHGDRDEGVPIEGT